MTDRKTEKDARAAMARIAQALGHHTAGYGLHLCAPNDRNGNPQRAYMVLADDGCHWVYEEGYYGVHAVPEHHRERIAGRWTRINISRAEYRRIIADK